MGTRSTSQDESGSGTNGCVFREQRCWGQRAWERMELSLGRHREVGWKLGGSCRKKHGSKPRIYLPVPVFFWFCFFLICCSRKKNVGRDPISPLFTFSLIALSNAPKARGDQHMCSNELRVYFNLYEIHFKHSENNRKQFNKHSHTYHPAFK